MAKFQVTYKDGEKETIEADAVQLDQDQYRFYKGRGDTVAYVPKAEVRKIEKAKE